MLAKKIKGAAIIEYVIGVAVLMFAMLFIPYEGETIAEMLYEAIKRNYSGFLYAVSVPI
jgi:hypothetical protein